MPRVPQYRSYLAIRSDGGFVYETPPLCCCIEKLVVGGLDSIIADIFRSLHRPNFGKS